MAVRQLGELQFQNRVSPQPKHHAEWFARPRGPGTPCSLAQCLCTVHRWTPPHAAPVALTEREVNATASSELPQGPRCKTGHPAPSSGEGIRHLSTVLVAITAQCPFPPASPCGPSLPAL